MIDTIYLERSAAEHPRVIDIRRRFPRARVIECEHYGEVFNRRNQNFRVHKQRPALILAHKNGRRILPVPAGYGLDGANGYYFSHMLNCLYDCRYCFLQGMFRSGHYVLFVNYEDFFDDIRELCAAHSKPTWLFSGYDCDSLALEPLSGFAAAVLPHIKNIPNAWLELRTKSTQVRTLLEHAPLPRVVCAFSLNPQSVIERLEHRTPSLAARLNAIDKLQRHGWPVALRFDPLILCDDFRAVYAAFFQTVFARLAQRALHSITLGAFRAPAAQLRRMTRLYPEQALFAADLAEQGGVLTYADGDAAGMLAWCEAQIGHYAANVPTYVQSA